MEEDGATTIAARGGVDMNTEWFGGIWQLHDGLAREEVFNFAEALAMDVVSPVGYYGPWGGYKLAEWLG